MSHLTPNEIETMKRMLEDIQQDTREKVRLKEENLIVEKEALTLDSLDRSRDLIAMESREQVDSALLDRQLIELSDVVAAIQRIADETYGTCVDCGGPIVYGRLKAYPTAKRCASCQMRHEGKDLQSH